MNRPHTKPHTQALTTSNDGASRQSPRLVAHSRHEKPTGASGPPEQRAFPAESGGNAVVAEQRRAERGADRPHTEPHTTAAVCGLDVRPARMFTFGTSTGSPRAYVRCHNCDWTAKGRNTDKVWPLADEHECPASTDGRSA